MNCFALRNTVVAASPGKFPRQEVQGLLHIQKSNEWYVFAMDIANQDDQDKYTGLINELARYVECLKEKKIPILLHPFRF